MEFKYCPKCRSEMAIGDLGYNYCQSADCNFVQYQNPTPVVAAVVEYGHNRVIVAHNRLYGLDSLLDSLRSTSIPIAV